jgi:4-amino-4-deoxy-L-arabinose transferase-like glycosyltransferase
MGQPKGFGLTAERVWVSILGGCFVLLALSHACTTSATYDEPPHVASGYVAWRWNDFRFNPEHPPLIKRIAALPLLALDPLPAEYDPFDPMPMTGEGSINWNRSRYAWKQALTTGDAEWVFAHGFLYGVKDRTLERLGAGQSHEVDPRYVVEPTEFLNDADRLILRARLPMIGLGLLLALMVFRWTRDLYGTRPALLALALYCFDPNYLAHSALVTTDVGLSLLMFGAVYFLWRTFRSVSVWSLAGFVTFSALAFSAKYTAALLPPMVFLILLIAPIGDRGWPARLRRRFRLTEWGTRACFGALLLVGAGVTIYVSIWAVYGFRHAAVAGPDPSPLPLETVLRRAVATKEMRAKYPQASAPKEAFERAKAEARIEGTEGLIRFANEQRVLPEGYLYGFAWARMKSLARRSFLRGEHTMHGTPLFFAWTFALKTPILTLLLLVTALVFLIRGRGPWKAELPFLLVPVVVYVAFSLTASLNIGHRHLLPVYPFLYVFCGGLVRSLPDRAGARLRWRTAPALAVVAFASSFVFWPPWKPTLIGPHYLPYFNELAGGPRNGHLSLVDSNLDWGQDLKHLKSWLTRRGIEEPIGLCYFGMADPRFYQIRHVKLPGGYELEPPFGGRASFADAPRPGYLAISATDLQGAYQLPEMREAWKAFLSEARLVDTVGRSIFVFYLP